MTVDTVQTNAHSTAADQLVLLNQAELQKRIIRFVAEAARNKTTANNSGYVVVDCPRTTPVQKTACNRATVVRKTNAVHTADSAHIVCRCPKGHSMTLTFGTDHKGRRGSLLKVEAGVTCLKPKPPKVVQDNHADTLAALLTMRGQPAKEKQAVQATQTPAEPEWDANVGYITDPADLFC